LFVFVDVYRIGLNHLLLPNWLMNRIEASRPFGFILRLDGYITNPSLGSASVQAGQAALSRSSLLPITNPVAPVSHFTPTVSTLGNRSSPSSSSSSSNNHGISSSHHPMAPASHFTPTVANLGNRSPSSSSSSSNNHGVSSSHHPMAPASHFTSTIANHPSRSTSPPTSNPAHHVLDLHNNNNNQNNQHNHKPSSPKPPSSN